MTQAPAGSDDAIVISRQQALTVASELRARLLAGLVVVALLVLAIGGWAATATLSGAVIAPGQVVVEGSSKKIQHPTGGVVGEILVKDGDRVAKGDILMRLDDTQTRASLGVVQSQLTELIGRRARLAAESNSEATIDFPDGFKASSPDAARVADGERRLFEARRKAAAGQKAQLRERVGQYAQEIEGLSVQRDAKEHEVRLVGEELDRVRDMSKRDLLPMTRLLATEREAIRVKAELGALVAQIARTKGQISETELQILSVDQGTLTEAQKDHREADARIAELAERRIAAEDHLRRVDIRAPHAGIVHQLAIHTLGAVIGAGEPVLMIVPDDQALSVEIRISPSDIDQILPGQKTSVRFPAFNQHTTPEITGILSRIAADLTQDAKSGASFYVAKVDIAKEDLARLGSLKLVPGMPVETFTETVQHTALTYLAKPLADQFGRAFREN